MIIYVISSASDSLGCHQHFSCEIYLQSNRCVGTTFSDTGVFGTDLFHLIAYLVTQILLQIYSVILFRVTDKLK